jgi:uncharacterized protein YbjT (DUF2867 family)
MRIEVRGAGSFLGGFLDAEIRRRGHELARPAGELDVVVHRGPEGVRGALDEAFARAARLFLYVAAPAEDAEERVRAAGLPWVVVRPDVMWGPGDALVTELAGFLRRMPFVPRPSGGPDLAPVAVDDVASALVGLVDAPGLWHGTWSLAGPEELPYAEVVERVAHAVRPEARRHFRMPAWLMPLGRFARAAPAQPLPFTPRRFMTVDAVRTTLRQGRPLLSW